MVRKLSLLIFSIALLWGLLPAPSAAAVESNNGVVLENNGIVSGTVQLHGVAQHPTFRKWQLDLLIDGDSDRAVFLALGEAPLPELGLLTTVDTTLYPDGEHLLRLRVVHSNLNYEENFTPITFANQQGAQAQTATQEVEDSTPPVAAAPTADPNGFQLAASTLQGDVDLQGVAVHPRFRKWQIDLLVERDPEQAHFIAVSETAVPALAPLATLHTEQFPDGEHLLRLRVVHSNLNYEEYYTPVTIQNQGSSSDQSSVVEDEVESAPEEAESAPLLGMDLSAAPADGVRRIEIDLSEQTLTAWQGDVVVMHTKVSTGRPETPTVLGRYQIRTKLPSQRMRGPGYDLPNVPSVMYFYAGYAIHGAYWHNNFGQVMSHGCVNMRLDEAEALYEWASIGTEVFVHE